LREKKTTKYNKFLNSSQSENMLSANYLTAMEEASKRNAELATEINTYRTRERSVQQSIASDRTVLSQKQKETQIYQSTLAVLDDELKKAVINKTTIESELNNARARKNQLRSTAEDLRSQIRSEKEKFVGSTFSSLMSSLEDLQRFVIASPEVRVARIAAFSTPEHQPTMTSGAGNGDTPHPGTAEILGAMPSN
jgi:chromosome segregation ATPase